MRDTRSLSVLDAGLVMNMRHRDFMSRLSELAPDAAIEKIKTRESMLKSRLWLLGELWGVLFGMLGLLLVGLIFTPVAPAIENTTGLLHLLLTVVRVTVIILVPTLGFLYPGYRQARINTQLLELNEEKNQQRLKKMAQSSAQPAGQQDGYFERFMQINVSNLDQMFAISRRQSTYTLSLALFALLAGFVVIVAGFYLADGQESLVDSAAKLGGVLMEFIAGGFFVLYYRTQKQLKASQDKITDVQATIMSMRIIGELKDEKERERLTGVLLSGLATSSGRR